MRYAKASVFVASLCLGAGVFLSNFGVANAGFEPSPFQPEINQLGAAENILVSANSRIVRSMDHPPDPCCPSPDLEGAVNRLGAINTQLMSVDAMVTSIVDEVMGVEPEPFSDLPDLAPALTGVQGAAQTIVEEIEARLGFEPSPFRDALVEVRGSAQTISTHAENYIEQITCPGGVEICYAQELQEQEECGKYACCTWFGNDNLGAGWCAPNPDYSAGM